jgi:hypothetical protein
MFQNKDSSTLSAYRTRQPSLKRAVRMGVLRIGNGDDLGERCGPGEIPLTPGRRPATWRLRCEGAHATGIDLNEDHLPEAAELAHEAGLRITAQKPIWETTFNRLFDPNTQRTEFCRVFLDYGSRIFVVAETDLSNQLWAYPNATGPRRSSTRTVCAHQVVWAMLSEYSRRIAFRCQGVPC